MSRILLLFLVMAIGIFAHENLPMSPKASEGKSVYVPAPAPVDVVEEGCVQKEDQNTTGYRNAKP
jgi:hypothetical protein